MKKPVNPRLLSVVSFSFVFAYLLSFLFEGQVLYSIMNAYGVNAHPYILSAIIAHFAGLFTCGFFIKIKSQDNVRFVIAIGMAVCIIATLPFFFAPSILWLLGLIFLGFIVGWAVAMWGYYLKVYTPKNERLKTCADVLIYSNLIMIAVNVVAINASYVLGLLFSMLCLVIGCVLSMLLPRFANQVPSEETDYKPVNNVKKPLLVLCLFVVIITINSGLMYQVINPSFEHLTGLVSWYWAVPYIVALVFMRNFPLQSKVQRSLFLYVGMGMIIAAFITFMLLGRNVADYLVIDTMMLGACGIFDLFWWSILGEMLSYTDNPVKVFGIGLSANVLGVLLGDVLGVIMTSVELSEAEVAVMALTVVCITLVILPPLNKQLLMLLKSHVYLNSYDRMDKTRQEGIVSQTNMIDPLTNREQEVLQVILLGKSNKEIATSLFISENTVKTHIRNIFSKYDVSSRAELITTLLKNQADS